MILTETIIAEIAAVIDYRRLSSRKYKERESNNYKRKRHKPEYSKKKSSNNGCKYHGLNTNHTAADFNMNKGSKPRHITKAAVAELTLAITDSALMSVMKRV